MAYEQRRKDALFGGGILAYYKYEQGGTPEQIQAGTQLGGIIETMLTAKAVRGRRPTLPVRTNGVYVSGPLVPGRPSAAESNLIPRLGQRGVDPLHHNANVLVRDINGNVISHERFVSGNMTLEEQMLPFPRNTLASHTEARAVRTTPLEPGQSMTITGQNPPCPSCKGAMNTTVTETGATIRYQWRQDGQTMIWVAKPKGQ